MAEKEIWRLRAPSLTGIFYMQGEEYSMKKYRVLGLAVLLAWQAARLMRPVFMSWKELSLQRLKLKSHGKSAGQYICGNGKGN